MVGRLLLLDVGEGGDADLLLFTEEGVEEGLEDGLLGELLGLLEPKPRLELELLRLEPELRELVAEFTSDIKAMDVNAIRNANLNFLNIFFNF